MSPTLLMELELVQESQPGGIAQMGKTLSLTPFLQEAPQVGGKERDLTAHDAVRITGTLSVSF